MVPVIVQNVNIYTCSGR